MQRLADSHRKLEEAERIARYLVDDRFSGELGHLAQARVLYLVSEREVQLRGWPAHAYICRPRCQGAMSAILEDLLAQFAGFDGHDPDFVVRFDRASWDSLQYADAASAFWAGRGLTVPAEMDWTIGQERLVFHELKHTYQRTDKDGDLKFSEEDGRPVLALRPHDAEWFHDELEFYGADICGAVDTALAIAAGIRAETAATRKRA